MIGRPTFPRPTRVVTYNREWDHKLYSDLLYPSSDSVHGPRRSLAGFSFGGFRWITITTGGDRRRTSGKRRPPSAHLPPLQRTPTVTLDSPPKQKKNRQLSDERSAVNPVNEVDQLLVCSGRKFWLISGRILLKGGGWKLPREERGHARNVRDGADGFPSNFPFLEIGARWNRRGSSSLQERENLLFFFYENGILAVC